MTHQEALTKVVLHARKQRERAVCEDGLCTYWNAQGRRCFLGCLLTEEDAQAEAENGTGTDDLLGYLGLELTFGGQLIRVHDREPPESWESELANVATKWGLEMPA